MMSNKTKENGPYYVSPTWWDSRVNGTFFKEVYGEGDDSSEGYLIQTPLDPRKRTQRECYLVEKYLNLHKGSKILDCPCGYGRHSITLAQRGYRMTGVDLNSDFISRARKGAQLAGVSHNCEFHEADMRTLPNGINGFDACINMFLSFGFFDDAENRLVLEGFQRKLVPNGQLLIHSDVNPDRIADNSYGDRTVRQLRSGGILTVEESFDTTTKRLIGTWTITSPDRIAKTCAYSVRIYTHEELKALLEECGFHEIRWFFPEQSSIKVDSFTPQEVVYVARKSG